jgi:hypothetical protein
MMKIKQAVLKNLNGNETMTTWLDVRPDLKIGATISLEGDERLWRVQQLFEQEHDAPIEFELGYNPHVNDWCGFGQRLGL